MSPNQNIISRNNNITSNTETENDNGEAFGTEKLKQLIMENSKADAKSMVNIITRTLTEFMENHARADDLTLIVMKRQSSNEYLLEL